MIIDMHVHTEASSESNVTVEDYCRFIEEYRHHLPFHGIVLTEHRLFPTNEEYKRLSDIYEVLIFQGIEVDTELGHLLLYGVTRDFLKRVDVSSRILDCRQVVALIRECGGIAVPAHPFRESVFGTALLEHQEAIGEITVIEERNGLNSKEQNEKAADIVTRNGLHGIGGSDAHYANPLWFLNCATEFIPPIESMDDIVNALRTGACHPVVLDNSVIS